MPDAPDPGGPKYALTEHLPMRGGTSEPKTLSEHPTVEMAIAARTRLQQQRPELIGCVTIVPVPKK